LAAVGIFLVVLGTSLSLMNHRLVLSG